MNKKFLLLGPVLFAIVGCSQMSDPVSYNVNEDNSITAATSTYPTNYELADKNSLEYKFPSTYTKQPSPPTNSNLYKTLSFDITTEDVQSNLGKFLGVFFDQVRYGCGPSAGAIQFWHLGKRNPQFWAFTNNRDKPSAIGSDLCWVDKMNPIGGTMINEYINGLNEYAKDYNKTIKISSKYAGRNSTLGSGQNSSFYSVWANIVEGIDKNCPVALAVGNEYSYAGTRFNDADLHTSTQGFEFKYHWVVVTGYLIDGPNYYLKVKSWGTDYYVSFDALYTMRDCLASVYIDEYYTRYGDLNGDDNVNSIDFALFRKYLLGQLSPSLTNDQMNAADVNNDGVVNSIDFAYMRQYLLSIISSFPADKI